MIADMFALLHSLAIFVIDFFKPRRRLVTENLFLRHQLSIALRRAPPRLRLRGSDRALLVLMTRLWPSLLGATHVVQPETILRWHRAGFRRSAGSRESGQGGPRSIVIRARDLIRRMSRENPKWGASRIHGELLMLGFEVAQSTVSNGMDRPCSRPQRHAESVGGFEEHEEDTPCPAKQTLQSHAPLVSIPVRTRCI